MTPTSRTILAIRKRLEATMPGQPGNYMPELEPCKMAKISASNEDFEFNVFDEFTLEEADAEFIANAPSDISLLLQTLELQQRALEFYTDENNWVRQPTGSCGDGCCTYYEDNAKAIDDVGCIAQTALAEVEALFDANDNSGGNKSKKESSDE